MEKFLEFLKKNEELEVKKGTSEPEIKGEPFKEEDGFVSIHTYDMLAQAYDAKCEECKAIGKEYKYLNKEFNEEIKKYSHERNELLNKVNLLEKENRKLTAELSKYRYFIECQKNEIEKLENHGLEKH